MRGSRTSAAEQRRDRSAWVQNAQRISHAGQGVGDEATALEVLSALSHLSYPNRSIQPHEVGALLAALHRFSLVSVRVGAAKLSLHLLARKQLATFKPAEAQVVASSLGEVLCSTTEGACVTEGDILLALTHIVCEHSEQFGEAALNSAVRGTLHHAGADAAIDVRRAAMECAGALLTAASLSVAQETALRQALFNAFDTLWRGTAAWNEGGPAADDVAAAEERRSLTGLFVAAARGLAEWAAAGSRVAGGGAVAALEPYMPRLIHALNHLVQLPPAEDADALMALPLPRSRDPSPTGAVGSAAKASAPELRANVRVQSLLLLEALASLSPRMLQPQLQLFLPSERMRQLPKTTVKSSIGGVAGCSSEVDRGDSDGEEKRPCLSVPLPPAMAAIAVAGGGAVRPAALVALMERDPAPQARAAAAAAVAALIKGAPLKLWIGGLGGRFARATAARATAATSAKSAKRTATGLAARVSSMMRCLLESLAARLESETSPDVLPKLCICTGVLATSVAYSRAPPPQVVAALTAEEELPLAPLSKDYAAAAGTFDALLSRLLAALARLMLDTRPLVRSDDVAARVAAAAALASAMATKSPLAAVDSFLERFRTPLTNFAGSSDSRGQRRSAMRPPSPRPAAAASLYCPAVPAASCLANGLAGVEDRGGKGGRWVPPQRRLPTAAAAAAVLTGAAVPVESQFPLAGPTGPAAANGLAAIDLPAAANGLAANGAAAASSNFVDRLLAVVTAAGGPLRPHALLLLARVGSLYPRHLAARQAAAEAALLRCLGDADQNVRLHAIKVAEETLRGRAKAAAAAAAVAAAVPSAALAAEPTAVEANGLAFAGGCASGSDSAASAEDMEAGAAWAVFLRRNLQRAFDDPYPGVRAVACACHSHLLSSDWATFPNDERQGCLSRILAATADAAPGVAALACRVVGDLLGLEPTPLWCQDRRFLAAVVPALLSAGGGASTTAGDSGGSKLAPIRAQALWAIGNLASMLHALRLLRCCGSTGDGSRDCQCSSGGCGCDGAGGGSGGGGDCDTDPPALQEGGNGWRDGWHLISGDHIHALCALSLSAAIAPGKAAASAIRALGFLPGHLDSSHADDVHLQDAAMQVLAEGVGGGGGGGGGGSGSDGQPVVKMSTTASAAAEEAAAKTSWGSCAALSVALHSPAIQCRMPGAPWAPALLAALTASLEGSAIAGGVKAQVHAAAALGALRKQDAYGSSLDGILTIALRGLQACKSCSSSPPANQARQAALEASLQSLVLHLLLVVLLPLRAPSTPGPPHNGDHMGTFQLASGIVAEGAASVMEGVTFHENADALLDVICSHTAPAAIASEDVTVYHPLAVPLVEWIARWAAASRLGEHDAVALAAAAAAASVATKAAAEVVPIPFGDDSAATEQFRADSGFSVGRTRNVLVTALLVRLEAVLNGGEEQEGAQAAWLGVPEPTRRRASEAARRAIRSLLVAATPPALAPSADEDEL